MSELSFTNFFNAGQAFGLNVKVPARTLQQIGKTAENVAGGVFEPLTNYFEENENVFNGNVKHEINRTNSNVFNTAAIMNAVDEKTNGPKPSFDAKF